MGFGIVSCRLLLVLQIIISFTIYACGPGLMGKCIIFVDLAVDFWLHLKIVMNPLSLTSIGFGSWRL